ncbi:MAG: DUF2207 domain-containing protein [Thermoplasmata archaeon]
MTAARLPTARPFRKKRWPLLAVIGLLATWLGLITPANAGGTYYVSNWDETIVVNQDASIAITENVTFTYLSGDFGFAFRTLVHRGFDELTDVRVTDGAGNHVDHTLSGGTFFQDYEIRWEWPRIYIGSEPVELTFVLSYVLTNAMNFENPLVDEDRLYWNIVTDYEVRIQDMDIDVVLPRGFPTDNVTARAYVFPGLPLRPEVQEGDPTIVRYHQPTLAAGGAYTVDVFFSGVVRRPASGPILEGPEYLIVIVPATIPLLLLEYRRRRRDPVTRDEAFISEVKEDLSPAEAGVLTDRRLRPGHLVATAISLGERGYLEIQAEFNRGQALREIQFQETGKDPRGLKEYEKSVYNQLRGKTDTYLAQGRGITSPIDYRTFVADGEDIKSELVEGGYAERHFFSPLFGIQDDRVFGVIIPLALLTLMVVLVYYGGLVENIWLFASGFLVIAPLGLSLAISGKEKRRTVRGARFKKAIDSHLRNLVSEIERDAESNPLSAADRIKNSASWLVLAVDRAWFRRTMRRLEKGMVGFRYEGFELPSYIRPPAELLDVKKTSALMVMFGAYERTYAGTSTYYAAAAASSPSSGGSGGGGGAGGGGGGGGGGSG